ncbi:zf-HC2 domain-containing protein [Marisediminicola senii]|uniref:zf-HC2 domain-containing protein n=1 Tax=Marisediminicola senii TaxID=2711233 RepID=UPI0013EE05FA|nr:zf-HC2 domain-containing protein [Marisediminicola senii]
MTDCGCDKAKAELEEYLHDELQATDAEDIAEHIKNCTSCDSEHHVGVVLTQAVQRACKETAPEVLRDQVLARIREMQSH